MSPRCEIQVPPSTYSSGGRCRKKHGIKPTEIREGSETVRVKMCRHHRAMVEANKTVTRCSILN